MNVQRELAKAGFKFKEGQEVHAEVIRRIAEVIRPDYVRHTGIESIQTALTKVGQPLEERIPDQLQASERIWVTLAFQRESEIHGWVSFLYDPTKPGKYRFDRVCEF